MASSSRSSSILSTESFVESGDDSDESEEEAGEDSSRAVSLLDRLKSPTASDLSRKRKVHCNPPTGKRRSSGRHGMKEPKIKPSHRVSEFPDEELSVSAVGRLFCKACRETLSVKRSTIANHVKSTKHQQSKEKLQKKQAREKDIASALKRYDETTQPKGQTLPDEQRIYRVKVVMAFLRAGIPISKLEYLRDILEENALRLTDTRHMLDLVPFILEEERSRIKEEISGKHLSLVFDGTSRLGEVLAVVIRYIDGWEIQQRLVRLEFLTKSMTGEEVARELINVLSVTFGVQSNLLLAAMRDRASVNNVAMRVVSIVYPSVLDVGCFSHTLDIVGEKFKTPVLSTFCTMWLTLFSHSPKTKALWKEQTGKAMASFSKTRWWSRWEILHQLMVQFGDIEPFLRRNEDIGPALRPKLLEIISNVQTLSQLKLELAAVIDVGEYFVKSTYTLEGDGPLVLVCYEEIKKLRAVIQTAHYPNVDAIAANLAPGNPGAQQQMVSQALSCVKGGLDYFQEKFGNDSISPLNAFRAAQYLSPSKVNEIQPSASDIDSLCAIPFLNDPTIIADLKKELPVYLAKADSVSPTINVLGWWKQNEHALPNWSSAARKTMLIQPSSAAAERVFSLLNNSFSTKQYNSLEDYIECSLLLQYNKH